MKTNLLSKLRGSILLSILVTTIFLMISSQTHASHYRYGNIRWQKLNNTTDSVEFLITTAWRGNYFTGTIPALNATINNLAVFNFGDNSTATMSGIVVARNVTENWIIVETRLVKKYNTAGNYTAFFTNCCRLSTLLGGGANGTFRSQTLVNIGNTNNPPSSTMPPIINLQTGYTAATFTVPGADPDNDSLRFRLATSAEVGINPPNIGGVLVTMDSFGNGTFNTNGRAVGSQFAVAVVISDGKSYTIVDFLVNVVAQSSPPIFDYSTTPSNGSTYQVPPGTPVKFKVKAYDNDAGSSVTLSAVGIPSGASWSPSAAANPVTDSFSWTPGYGDLGTRVITFTAQDNINVQTQTSVTIKVSLKPIFDVPPTPSSVIVAEPGDSVNFTVQAYDPDNLDSVTINKLQGIDNSAARVAMSNSLYAGANFNLPTNKANPTSGNFSWVPANASWGLRNLYFTAEDKYADKTEYMVEVIVNTTPAFVTTPPTNLIVAGNTFTYNIQVHDTDMTYGDTLEILDLGLPSWLTLTDNGDGTATLTGTPVIADSGTYAITLVAEDLFHHSNVGGIPEQTFNLQVIPCFVTANCQNITAYLNSSGIATVTPADVNNNSVSNCGIASLTLNKYSFDCSNTGDNSVTLTVTDIYNNESTCNATVTVSDTTKPIIAAYSIPSLPKTISMLGRKTTYSNVKLNGGSNYINAAPGQSITLSYDRTSAYDGGAGCPGCITQHYIGLNGVFSLCHNASGGSSSPGVTFATPTTPGVYYITQTATWWYYCDQFGVPATSNDPNLAIAVVYVTDGTNHCGNDITVNANANDCSALVNFQTPMSIDNCSSSINQTSGYASGASYPVGTTTNTYVAVDASNNTSTCSFNITVVDNTNPTAICKNSTVQLGKNGTATIGVGDVDNGSNDACGIKSVSIDKTSFDCSNVGDNTVTLTVTDNNNNVSTCTATVTVEDTIKPIIAAYTIPSLPKTISMLGRKTTYSNVKLNGGSNYINAAPGQSITLSYDRTSAYDGGAGCPGCITQHYIGLNGVFSLCHNASGGSSSPGVTFAAPTTPGVYYITQTATWWYYCDQFGVPATSNDPNLAIAVVYVTDGTNHCGNDITVNANANDCSALVNFQTPMSIDNCSSSINQTTGYASGASFPVGTTTNTWVATDASNNTSTCSFNVTVVDNTNPTAICQGFTLQLGANGTASITAAQVNNGSNDACGIKSVSIDKSDFDCSNVGDNTVTLTVTDNNDNVSTCEATIVVEDNVAPTAVCQPVTVTLVNGAASVTAAEIDNGSSDACGIKSIALDNYTFDCSNIGANTVILTVTDNNDNVSTCTTTVTVVGTIPTVEIAQSELPGFCQGGTYVLTANADGGAAFSYAWSTNETTQIIQVQSTATYEVEVTNNYGCKATDDIAVNYTRENLLSSYTIIANKEVEIEYYSALQSGGAGATSSKGEVEVEKYSTITNSGTFAMAKKIEVKNNSTVTTKINSAVGVTLPDFKYNPYCKSEKEDNCKKEDDKDHKKSEKDDDHDKSKNNSSSKNINIDKNKNVTLTDSIYGKISVGKNSHVTFTSSVIYIKELKTNDTDTISFTEPCVKMMVCDDVELKKDNIFNMSETSVTVYVAEDFKVNKNSRVTATVYAKGEIDVDGDQNNKSEMKGMFIANEVKSKHTNWNWNTTCSDCQQVLNKRKVAPVANLSGLIDADAITLSVYPNPNRGKFGIDVYAPEVGTYEITIYDALGRVVMTTGTQKLSGPTYVPINIEKEGNAHYFIRANVNGQIFTKNIVVNSIY